MIAVHQHAVRWIKCLPLRWALGGLILGLVWSLISSLVQGSFSNPSGGLMAALFRVSMIVVLPLGLLGFAWGLTERIRLQRCARDSRERLVQAINRNFLHHAVIGAIVGALFWLFLRHVAPWTRITSDSTGILGLMLLAAFVGILVGVVSKRTLLRAF
jgi:hypothetical protein